MAGFELTDYLDMRKFIFLEYKGFMVDARSNSQPAAQVLSTTPYIKALLIR